MTIGHVPIRERLLLPRRGAPLEAVLTGASSFPVGTTATLKLYDKDDDIIDFWPLTVSGATITIDIPSEDLMSIPNHCGFTISVVYPTDTSKSLSWYEGAALRMV